MNRDSLTKLNKIISVLDKVGYSDSYRIANEIISEYGDNEEQLSDAIQRLKADEPWEYIRGSTAFCGIEILLDPSTLIPRLETEQLVEICSSATKKQGVEQIIDVGTGSGAIICALAKRFPGKKMIGIDTSENALKIAKKNVENNGLKVAFIQNDLLEGVKTDPPTLLVANLPYIPTQQYRKLDPSVKNFEPQSALDGGKSGTKYIERLLIQASESPKISTIALEIDPLIGKRVLEIANNLYPKAKTTLIEDFRDQTRFLTIERE